MASLRPKQMTNLRPDRVNFQTWACVRLHVYQPTRWHVVVYDAGGAGRLKIYTHLKWRMKNHQIWHARYTQSTNKIQKTNGQITVLQKYANF